jgi:hypothetical protein
MLSWNTKEFTESVSEALENKKIKLMENMDKTLEIIHNTSNKFAPEDTGEMVDDSGYNTRLIDNQIIGTIGYLQFYSIYVHQGTGIHALNGDGRKTPWCWFPTTQKWISIAHELNGNDSPFIWTRGQRPKQFLYKAFLEYEEEVPILLSEGV